MDKIRQKLHSWYHMFKPIGNHCSMIRIRVRSGIKYFVISPELWQVLPELN